MYGIVSKIYNAILKIATAFIHLRGRISFGRNEKQEDKAVCKLREKDWEPLTRKEKRKYRKDRYTYTVFKNVAPMFEEYPDYFVTEKDYITEVLPRVSRSCHKVDGTPIDTIFNDKNYFERLFPEITFPKAIVRCVNGTLFDGEYRQISRGDAIEKLRKYDNVVFKRTVDTQHGEGVVPASGEKILETFDVIGENFIVQELIKQHSFLAGFNSTSVNVIRVVSMFWKGKCYIIDSRLRVGAPGSFCDHTGFDGVGSLEIGIAEDGSFRGEAYDDTDGKYYSTVFGHEITGAIPAYQEMLDIASRGQTMYPAYGMLGWDFTVAEDGSVVCIEVNSRFPSTKSAQCISGPIFMKKTADGNILIDEIMKEPIKIYV